MAEDTVFNPPNWKALGMPWNPNPTYAMPFKPGRNTLSSQPRLGQPYTRNVSNLGHTFQLAWVGVPSSLVDSILISYHYGKQTGWFTFIHVDYGRYYSGQFVTEPEVSHPANGKYTVQGVTFQEIPKARMLVYPSDFSRWGVFQSVVDDNASLTVACMQGTWNINQAPGSSINIAAPFFNELLNVSPAAGDWAQTAYTGYGFQMVFRTGDDLGVINFYLDGVLVLQDLDLGPGTFIALPNTPPFTLSGAGNPRGPLILTFTEIPLDRHRIKIVYQGASVEGGTTVIFPNLVYIA